MHSFLRIVLTAFYVCILAIILYLTLSGPIIVISLGFIIMTIAPSSDSSFERILYLFIGSTVAASIIPLIIGLVLSIYHSWKKDFKYLIWGLVPATMLIGFIFMAKGLDADDMGIETASFIFLISLAAAILIAGIIYYNETQKTKINYTYFAIVIIVSMVIAKFLLPTNHPIPPSNARTDWTGTTSSNVTPTPVQTNTSQTESPKTEPINSVDPATLTNQATCYTLQNGVKVTCDNTQSEMVNQMAADKMCMAAGMRLPTLDELKEMYLHQNEIPNLAGINNYEGLPFWSASVDGQQAVRIIFAGGSFGKQGEAQYVSITDAHSNGAYIRCVKD